MLADNASWLNQERGILTVCRLKVGDLLELGPEVPRLSAEMNTLLEQEGLTAFAEVDIVSDFESGCLAVAQANGIAGIDSNTLMFGWSEKLERTASRLKIMRLAAHIGKSTIVCRIVPRPWMTMRRIDIWWGGLQNNGDMLLLFAHLMTANSEWSGAEIRVKSIASNAMTFEQSEISLRELIQRSRIRAHAEVIRRPEGATVQDIIHQHSSEADLVFMGLREPKPGNEEAYAERLSNLVEGLPTVMLVRAAGSFAGQLL